MLSSGNISNTKLCKLFLCDRTFNGVPLVPPKYFSSEFKYSLGDAEFESENLANLLFFFSFWQFRYLYYFFDETDQPRSHSYLMPFSLIILISIATRSISQVS